LGVFLAIRQQSEEQEESFVVHVRPEEENVLKNTMAASSSVRNHSAFVLGATGEVGRELVRELLSNEGFSRVTTLGRTPLDYDGPNKERLLQRTLDFEKLEDFREEFRGHDIGFCCLGTSRAKSGTEGFKRVDHHYVAESARIAKEEGSCLHFNLVTSMGSNKNSWFLYPKTKGLAEEDVKNLKFDRLSVFRPAYLECERKEARTMERLYGRYINPLLKKLFPSYVSVSTSTVAKAMVNNVFFEKRADVEILDNKAIRALGKE